MSKLLSITLGLLLISIGTVSAAPGEKPGVGEQCVEPTDDMRRNHMEYILHQRDRTMHEGVRTKQHSLKGCIGCHAKKDDAGNQLSVNAEGQFCQSCHAYAAVRLDCFECHATKPAKGFSPEDVRAELGR